MSKGCFATNTLSGKLGAYVFMRRNGEQVQRSWVKPKDAQTKSQGIQRSALTNIIRIYQADPGFFKKAFQNKPSNQSDYNALVARNLGQVLKVYLPKEVADAGGGVVAPYVISDGSLRSIITSGEGITTRTNIAVGEDYTIDGTTTVGSLTQAILANNTFIQAGDQISYLSIEQYTDSGVPKLRSRKYEMILDPSSEELVYSVMPKQAVDVDGGYLAHGEFVYSGAFAWVLSRMSGDQLQVSRQNLIVTEASLYSAYTGSEAGTRAATSYKNNKEIFLDPVLQVSGTASTPSARPSVASVSVEGTTLSVGRPSISLDVANTIAEEQLVIQGSNFTGVTQIVVTARQESSETDVQATVPVTVEADTMMVNTGAITLTGVTSLSYLAISINGGRVFSWESNDLSIG